MREEQEKEGVDNGKCWVLAKGAPASFESNERVVGDVERGVGYIVDLPAITVVGSNEPASLMVAPSMKGDLLGE